MSDLADLQQQYAACSQGDHEPSAIVTTLVGLEWYAPEQAAAYRAAGILGPFLITQGRITPLDDLGADSWLEDGDG